MVEGGSVQLDAVFRALGDSARRQMLHRLSGREQTVTELAAPFDMSLAAAAKHITVLERAGLVSKKVRGRTHVCRLDAGRLAEAHEWLGFYERFWSERLDVLERELRFLHDELSAEATPDRWKGENHVNLGRITRCEPPVLLSYTWDEESDDDSEVTFELAAQGSDVLLVLTHRRLRDTDLLSVASGWHTHVGILGDRRNEREPRLFWTTHSKMKAEYRKLLGAAG